MADEIINHYEDNWEKVIDWLTGPIPEEKTIFYQKHMCHHMLPNIRFEWLSNVTNCFLIRDPNEMLTSLMKKLPNPTLMDTGLPQQLQIFNYVREATDETPPVIDSKDVLQNPRGILNALCNRLKIEFSELMLKWPPGIRKSDGIWAKHWYPEVETTTGWRPFRNEKPAFAIPSAPLVSNCSTYSCTSLVANQSSRFTVCASTSIKPTNTSFFSRISV
jgi:hypothetical protein